MSHWIFFFRASLVLSFGVLSNNMPLNLHKKCPIHSKQLFRGWEAKPQDMAWPKNYFPSTCANVCLKNLSNCQSQEGRESLATWYNFIHYLMTYYCMSYFLEKVFVFVLKYGFFIHSQFKKSKVIQVCDWA